MLVVRPPVGEVLLSPGVQSAVRRQQPSLDFLCLQPTFDPLMFPIEESFISWCSPGFLVFLLDSAVQKEPAALVLMLSSSHQSLHPGSLLVPGPITLATGPSLGGVVALHFS